MDNETYSTIVEDPQMANLLGQALIRDDLLPSILGSDNHEISYWAGKHLSRSHRLANYDDLIAFFTQFKLGDLSLLKKSSGQLNWQLSGDIVKKKIRFIRRSGFLLGNRVYCSKLPVYCRSDSGSRDHKNQSFQGNRAN